MDVRSVGFKDLECRVWVSLGSSSAGVQARARD